MAARDKYLPMCEQLENIGGFSVHSAARNGVSAATAKAVPARRAACGAGRGYLRAGEGAGGERRPVIAAASARTSPVSRMEEAWAYCAA